MKSLFSCFLLLTTISISSQSLNIPLIKTTGTAQVYIPVDEVHFNLQISKTALTIAEARKKNIAIADEVVNLLRKKGIPAKYIQSSSMNISRNYKKHSKKKEWDGFISNQTIYVCLTDPSKYDDILDGLLIMDIASVRGPEYKSTRAKEAIKKARKDAIVIAKEKATELCSSLGQTLGKAKLISENFARSANTDTYSSGTSLVADIDSGDLSFQPGQLVVKASVTVSFELLE